MPLSPSLQWSVGLAVGAFVLTLLAERLHARRIDVVANLAVGPTGRVRHWVRSIPAIRAIALAAMVWALATLYFAGGRGYGRESGGQDLDGRHRVVFVADLSPSMHLADAGPSGEQTRVQRMHEVIDAVLKRLDGEVVFGVVCFYTDALQAIVDAEDSELVRNIFSGLPVWYVMESGKTDLGNAVRTSLELLQDDPQESTTVFICTDGDTLPMGRVPKRPQAIRDVYVLGVGDPNKGTFIDDHMSRQHPSVLQSLAGRLGGRYFDVNEKHLPTLSLGTLAGGGSKATHRFGLVESAIYVFVAAAVVHALLPVMLGLFGSDWKPVRVPTRLELN